MNVIVISITIAGINLNQRLTAPHSANS